MTAFILFTSERILDKENGIEVVEANWLKGQEKRDIYNIHNVHLQLRDSLNTNYCIYDKKTSQYI